MRYGWVGQILEVDLSTGTSASRPLTEEERADLGGRSLASRLAWALIPPHCDAYDPRNVVIIATGPLSGTLAPTTGRTIMSAVSPRTYPWPWYTHSTLGGWLGPALKYAGYDALVLRGAATAPVLLDICDDQVRLLPADDLWGQGARATQLALRARLGDAAQILAIGPAGENLVRFATVQHAEENAAAHSGFGAVWGAKKLKAIAIRGSGGVAVAEPEALLQEVLRAGKFRRTPCPASIREAATQPPKPVCSQSCTFDCWTGHYGLAEDGRRVPGFCVGGSVWLKGVLMDHTRYESAGVRVPAGRNHTAAEEVRLHVLANDLGLDLWFRLVIIPWLLRAQELGIQAIRGYRFDPHSAAWLEQFMHELAHRAGLGALLADDLRRAMDVLEGELPEELIALGRELEFDFGFPAHREGRFWDEEPLPFWVISAMMHASESRDPTIGAHQSSLLLAELPLADAALAERQFRALGQQVWGDAEALLPTLTRKAPVAVWSQDQHMLIDSLPLCDFAFPQLVRPLSGEGEWRATEDICGDLDLDLRLLRAVTGRAYSRADLTRVAARACARERLLLARAGRGRPLEECLAPHFRLPCRADGTFVESVDFARLLDEFYAARGWDLELGWPTAATLRALGLEDCVPELEALRRSRSHA